MRVAVIAGLVIGCGVASAQTAPVKMGLWESTRVVNVAGQPPRTVTAQVCLTPETWEKSVGNVNAPHPGCSIKTVKSAKGYTFEGSCVQSGVTIQMHGMEMIDDAEHTHSSSTSSVVMNGKTMETSSSSTHHFVSASCGAVKPGQPVMGK